jgi:hypothetical protein
MSFQSLTFQNKKLMRTDFIAQSFCRGNMLIKDNKKMFKNSIMPKKDDPGPAQGPILLHKKYMYLVRKNIFFLNFNLWRKVKGNSTPRCVDRNYIFKYEKKKTRIFIKYSEN